MKIFITGATGVIGRRVTAKLLADGHQVTGLSRSVKNYHQLEKVGALPVWGNIYDPEEMQKAIRGHEIVIHLASSVPVSSQKLTKEDWIRNDLIREKGTDCLAGAAVANGVKLFLVPSVMLTYGNRKGDWVNETTPLSTDIPSDLVSAVTMEDIVHQYIRKAGLPAAILRLGRVYAADSLHTLALMDQLQAGEPAMVGRGDAWWNLIHADDAASAIVQTVKHYGLHVGATYNVCDGNPVLARDYVEQLAHEIGVGNVKSVGTLSAWLKLGKASTKVAQLSFRAKNSKAVERLRWNPAYPNYKAGLREVISTLRGKQSQKAA